MESSTQGTLTLPATASYLALRAPFLYAFFVPLLVSPPPLSFPLLSSPSSCLRLQFCSSFWPPLSGTFARGSCVLCHTSIVFHAFRTARLATESVHKATRVYRGEWQALRVVDSLISWRLRDRRSKKGTRSWVGGRRGSTRP